MQVQVEALQEDARPPEQAATTTAAAATAAGGATDRSGETGVTDSPSSPSAASSHSPSRGNLNPPVTSLDMVAQSPTPSNGNSLQAVSAAPWQRWPAAAAALAETDAILSRGSPRAPRIVQENSDESTMMYRDSFAATATTAAAGGASGGGVAGAGRFVSAAHARADKPLQDPSHPAAMTALAPDAGDPSAGGTGVSSGVAWQGTPSEQEATGQAASAARGRPGPGLEVLRGEARQRIEGMRFAGTDLMEVAAVLLSGEED